MRKVQAMPHKAIAAKLGISTSAVEKHIAYGTQRCKAHMQQHNKNDTPHTQDMPRGQSHE